MAIQDAMGWLDYHLHMFRLRNPVTGQVVDIGIPDEDAFEGDPVCLAGWEIPVVAHFDAAGRRQSGTKYPRCLDGQCACPPEDCGGPHGYAQLLQTIADQSDENYESTMQWLGGSFDPTAFSSRQVRFWNPRRRWKIAFARGR